MDDHPHRFVIGFPSLALLIGRLAQLTRFIFRLIRDLVLRVNLRYANLFS